MTTETTVAITETPAPPKAVPTVPKWQEQADEQVKNLKKFVPHIKTLVDRDANESDTRFIVTDILTEVLGYDKYSDLSTEYQTRGEFADYGLRIDGQLVAMIEVKRAAQKLLERHLRQVESYGLKEGVEWLILTNGAEWRLYHLATNGGGPVKVDLAFQTDLTQSLTRAALTQFATLHKSYWKRGLLDIEWNRLSSLSPENLKRIFRSERVLNSIRLEIKAQNNHTATNEAVEAAVTALHAE
jgi:predicted type IV restriction endonuclease